MTDRQLGPVHGTSPFSARDLFVREWPYLVMLALAIFGVAYTSFAQRPLTVYWMTLVPFIGTICVLSRWRDVEWKEEHLRLIWTQALHWGALLLAMNLLFVADVQHMMNADASALSMLILLALGTLRPASMSPPGASVLSGSCWRSESLRSRGSSNRHCSSFSPWWLWQQSPICSGSRIRVARGQSADWIGLRTH